MKQRITAYLRGPDARRILRFLIAGGGLFALDFTLFFSLIHAAEMDVWWAQTISASVRVVIGFGAHKWFTFAGDTKDDAKTTAKQGVIYAIQGLINIPISAVVVTACVWAVGGWASVGKVLSEGVLAVWAFFLYRYVVWRPES